MENSFYYNLINLLKLNGIINSGVSIPYLIGASKIVRQDITLDDNIIYNLLKEIINTSLINHVAVLQKCPDIAQYVIKFEDRKFAEKYMKKDVILKNYEGISTLFINQNASNLGSTIPELAENISRLYLQFIKESKFSWNKKREMWDIIDSSEINLIKQCKF